MAVDFTDFTTGGTLSPDNYLVGYDVDASGGEKKWKYSTLLKSVSADIPAVKNVADSSTVNLHFTSSTGTLSADVIDSSVTNSKLAFDGGSFAFRNKIINGNFDIWQRGTTLASGTGTRFLADRFRNNSLGSTYSASQQFFTVGQTDVPNSPSFFHRVVVSSVAGNANNVTLRQAIENVSTFSGETVTLSFYAKADSPKNIAVDFAQDFGTGGTSSSPVSGIGTQKLSLTTSWQKFTGTTSIPSISGKTIGTDLNSFLNLVFWFDAGSDFNSRTNSLGQQSGTFDIAQVQLEEGSVATPFEQRPIGTELALCQRYFISTRIGSQNGHFNLTGEAINTSTIVLAGTQFPVVMRATPTTNVYSSSADIAGRVTLFNDNLTPIGSGFTLPAATPQGIFTRSNGSNSLTIGDYYSFSYTASSEL
jgi:hypothetical protein